MRQMRTQASTLFPNVPQHSSADLTDAQAHIGTSPASLPSPDCPRRRNRRRILREAENPKPENGKGGFSERCVVTGPKEAELKLMPQPFFSMTSHTGLNTPTPGMIVCTSGATTDIAPYCGFVEGPPVYFIYIDTPIAAGRCQLGFVRNMEIAVHPSGRRARETPLAYGMPALSLPS